jgi:hypothetical protein
MCPDREDEPRPFIPGVFSRVEVFSINSMEKSIYGSYFWVDAGRMNFGARRAVWLKDR